MIKDTITAATIEELEAKKTEYLRRYPECGYGTWFKTRVETATGWSIEVERYRSCD